MGLPCLKYLEQFSNIRDAFKFVSLRPKSHLIAPYHKWTQKKYCLREQTHSSKLQLVFVIHSQQIVLLPNLLYAELLSIFDSLATFLSLPVQSGFEELFPREDIFNCFPVTLFTDDIKRIT